MGFFSLFSSKNIDNQDMKGVDFNSHFDKDFFCDIVDSSKSMMLYYFEGEGWIGANKTFFDTLEMKDIEEFNRKYDSVRGLFLSESEEIFTESDKSWMDYIKKYSSDGYRVSFAKINKEVIVMDVKCHTFSKNKHFYILELEDVTELHNANLKTLEVAELKSKFLSNIGHEFRTPMNGILGFVELMKQTDIDKVQTEYINMINSSSKNLMTNIETLLDLSQLQGGRLSINNTDFNILPEMEKLAYAFSVQGAHKGLKVLTFIDPKLPQEIYSDDKKIIQVMFSITQNAIKFTPRGGKVIIEVKLLKRHKNGDCSIGFGVKDNGLGISSAQIEALNEPFTSENQADDRLGVGLSLSYGLVELLGSELKIQSEEGNGTYINFVLDFKDTRGQNYKMVPKRKVKVLLLDQSKIDEANFLTIYLRSFSIDVIKSNQLDANIYDGVDALYIVANQDDSSWMLELGTYSKKTPITILLDKDERLQTKLTHIVDEVMRRPLLPSSVAKHLNAISNTDQNSIKTSKVNIKEQVNALVVEDNLINQKLIQIILEGYDINVSTASDGVEAVDMCAKEKYDIVFMDIDMPEKDGIVATREIKDVLMPNGKTPIVALTAMAMEGDKERLLSAGLDDYMPKPLTRDKLESILNTYLKVTA